MIAAYLTPTTARLQPDRDFIWISLPFGRTQRYLLPTKLSPSPRLLVMKANIRLSTFVLCVSLLFVSPAHAQMSDKEKREKEQEKAQQLERKAYALVEETANGAPGLKLPENRLYILTTAADLLWDGNNTRARSLFWDALNSLTLMAPPANSKDAKPSAKDKEKEQAQFYLVFSLRQNLLRQVARHDPTLALDMLRSSRQPPPEFPNKGFRLPDDHELEQQIAAEAVSNDPERALKLARESLAKGLSFQLLDLLYRLNQKDGELGTKFAGDIIEKLKTKDLATDPYGPRLALSLINYSRTPTAVPERMPAATVWRQLKLDEDRRRELVELITNAALAGSASANLLFNLDEIMPEIEQFTPERVAVLQRKLAGFNQTLNKEQRLSQEYNSLFRHGTPEEMIKLAYSTKDYDREWMQQQAVLMAVMSGRADKLREFANSEIDDEGRRRSLLDELDSEQIDYAVAKGNADELRKLLPQVRRKEERARGMVQIALVMEKAGKHDDALKLLDEAQAMIKTDLSSETHTNALLALIAAYAAVEPTKAFGLAERVIDRANDDVSRLLLLDKFANSGIVKKGEIRLQNSGAMPIDFVVFKFGKGVVALANADFERTKAAADRFERQELRLMARLMLAQSLLGGGEQTQFAAAK